VTGRKTLREIREQLAKAKQQPASSTVDEHECEVAIELKRIASELKQSILAERACALPAMNQESPGSRLLPDQE